MCVVSEGQYKMHIPHHLTQITSLSLKPPTSGRNQALTLAPALPLRRCCAT